MIFSSSSIIKEVFDGSVVISESYNKFDFPYGYVDFSSSKKYKKNISSLRFVDNKSKKVIVPNVIDHTKISYNRKAIKSGNLIEYFLFPCNFSKGGVREQRFSSEDKDSFDSQLKKIEGRIGSRRRSKRNFIRLVNSNADDFTKFLTLTFDPNIFPDCKNVEVCNHYFSNFIKRLKRLISDYYPFSEKLKYIAGIEFQNNGHVHYHVLLNIPYFENYYDSMSEKEQIYVYERFGVKKGFLEACWGAGFVNIQSTVIDKNGNKLSSLGSYIASYMDKSFVDNDLFGKKVYFASRNLKKPEVFYNDSADDLIEKYSDCVSQFQEITNNYISFSKILIDIRIEKPKFSKYIKNVHLGNDYYNLSDFSFNCFTEKFTTPFSNVQYTIFELYDYGFISKSQKVIFERFFSYYQDFKAEKDIFNQYDIRDGYLNQRTIDLIFKMYE